MATNYQQEMVTRSSDAYIAAQAREVQKLLDLYGPWIDTYRGGLPREWAAAIMNWESGGNFAAPGDPSLGEVGFYQVAEYFPAVIGMPAESRNDPETNVMQGLTEYQLEAVKWAVTFPDLVELGTADSLKLARLSFAVGWGGATGLARIVQNDAESGNLYGAIVDWANRTGGMPLGSQSSDQVWFRVVSIDPQWAIAKAVAPFGSLAVGQPTFPPNPPGNTYTIPDPYAAFFQTPTNPLYVAVAVLGIVVLWRYFS